MNGDFLKASYFESTKDRVIRSLNTYFESRRADSHALYYRDALLASKDGGIEESLALVQDLDFESVKEHHKRIFMNRDITIDCLFSGNVSEESAKEFYKQSKSEIRKTQDQFSPTPVETPKAFTPGKINSLRLYAKKLKSRKLNFFSLHGQSVGWSEGYNLVKTFSYTLLVRTQKRRMDLSYLPINQRFPDTKEKGFHIH